MILLSQYDGATSLLNLLLSSLCEEAGFDNDRAVRKATLPEDLEVSVLGNINDRGLITIVGSAGLLADERPKTVNIDLRRIKFVLLVMEVTLTYLTEVTWMARRN